MTRAGQSGDLRQQQAKEVQMSLEQERLLEGFVRANDDRGVMHLLKRSSTESFCGASRLSDARTGSRLCPKCRELALERISQEAHGGR